MSRTIGLISELEVVNSVLSVAGDDPVQSLDDSYQPVYIIRDMINTVSRRMQTKGYWFNQEFGVELSQNTVSQKITVPFNILKFEPSDNRYVLRGTTVYDSVDRTNIISGSIVADLTLMMTFDELPQSFREYIRAYCRVQYNNEYFGETNFKADLNAALRNAEIELEKEHTDNVRANVFRAQGVTNIAFQNRRG